MAAFFSRFSPIPAYPTFTGPYDVGTLEVEIPVTELPSPPPAPEPTIPTISFRIFYPCERPTQPSKPVYWLPDPQRDYFGAYIRFLGASRRLSGILQYLPFFSLISRVAIPAYHNAKLLFPTTKSKRWPLMLFSHGLGGSRNAYSQIVGSMASHGMVVVAPDHRDGSAPASFVRNPDGSFREIAEYKMIPHRWGKDVEDARNEQLRIRLWELGLVYEALMKIDREDPLTNLVLPDKGKNAAPGDLAMFGSSLDVHKLASISWSGHSFGAVTVVQFVKSVFYRHDQPSLPPSQSLYTPAEDSSITRQISPSSPLILFDLWSLPLRTKATEWLWKKPLPCYTDSDRTVSNVLSILSEAFVKWRANYTLLQKAIFPDYSLGQERAKTLPPPHVFYPLTSTHMGQSDFGVLSPKLTEKVFKSDDPVRVMRLNIRAALELLRQNGYEVADTSPRDMDMEAEPNGDILPSPENQKQLKTGQDLKILATDGSIKGWMVLKAGDGLDNDGDGDDAKSDIATNVKTSEKAAPSEAVIEGEIMKTRPTNGMARRVSSMTEWDLPSF